MLNDANAYEFYTIGLNFTKVSFVIFMKIGVVHFHIRRVSTSQNIQPQTTN